MGTDKFLNAVRDRKIDSKLWFPILEKLIYQTCLDAILARNPELKNFNVEVHERLIKEFAKLDYNQLNVARERLKNFTCNVGKIGKKLHWLKLSCQS